MSSHELIAMPIHQSSDKTVEQVSNETKTTPVPPDYKPNARPAVFRTTIHEVLFVFIATMGVAMPSLLQGCTIIISSSVKRDLSMSTTEITWMTASSALTSGSFLLFFGKLADMFGRRSMFLASLFLFAAFALGTGFSQDALTLIILNGVMGLMCALAVPPCQGILGSIYEKPSRRKNLAFASFSAGNPLGFVFGTIFSGIATQLFGWRAPFWLLAIIYLVVAIIAGFTVPVDDSDKLPLTVDSFKQFDVIGAALIIGGIGLFSTALSAGPDAAQGFKSTYILVFLILGVVLIVAFILWETRFPFPLMPMNVWRDREFCLIMVVLVPGFLVFPPMTFFIALYLQELFHYSALLTAVHMLPMAVSGIIINVVAGLILHRVSNKILMGIGTLAYTIASILVAVQRSGDSYWAFTFPSLVIIVVGADFHFNVANMYVLSSLPKAQQSIAASIFQTITKLAVTVGFGVETAVFNSVVADPASTGYYDNDPYEPFAAVFWAAAVTTFLSLFAVPFLRIKTQGNHD
ncbi:hypothetical protein AA0116_g5770 [Alternaria tenuissima]|nr:hypothetical protein AA0116_g5770 [Alternaria tenuissima]